MAGPPLKPKEQRDSLNRLAAMIHWNTKTILGEAYAQLAPRYTGQISLAIPAFGDGDMAPHNWIESRDSKIFKTGGLVHDTDHSIVGRQSLLWDVAGAIIEWKLNWPSAKKLISALRNQSIAFQPAALHFHLLAYAAFRLAQTQICRNSNSQNSRERKRLYSAFKFYRAYLVSLLSKIPR
jgi:hypothetical protein